MDRHHARHAYNIDKERNFQRTDNETQSKSLAQQILSEARGEQMLKSCDSEETYREKLQILIKCLCYEENTSLQGGIIEIMSTLILQRCNVRTMDDLESDDLIEKGSELLTTACFTLEGILRRRISKQREVTFALINFASQNPSRIDMENKNVHGLYIPAMVLARHLFSLQYHDEDEEYVWERKFFGLFGRLVFGMGFRGEAVCANRKELELCTPLLESLSQKSFDKAIVPVISFKMMEEAETAIHMLALFLSFLSSKHCSQLLESHLDDGLNLVLIGLNMLRHGTDDDVHNSATHVLVALVKSCSCAALVMISQALLVELSYRGTESVHYRMTLYHAFEEVAMVSFFQYASDHDLLKAHFHNVTDSLKHSLELESSMDEEEAMINCEAALEAWMALKGEDGYQPIVRQWHSLEPDPLHPTIDNENVSESILTSFRSESNRSAKRLESEKIRSEPSKSGLYEFVQKSKRMLSSKNSDVLNDVIEPESKTREWTGPFIKLWPRKRTKN